MSSFLRLRYPGASVFVDVDDKDKQRKYKNNFDAVPDLDSNGQLKVYSESEVNKIIGISGRTDSSENIFNIKPVVKNKTSDKE